MVDYKFPVTGAPVASVPVDIKKLAEAKKAQQATEIKKKLEATKKKAESFKKDILAKHKTHIVGISVLPPRSGEQGNQEKQEPEILLLLDIKEEDLKKKFRQKDNILKDAKTIAKKNLPGININCLLLYELWDACSKGKYEILNIITIGLPVYDTGWLGSLRAAELHKMQVLKKFEKYVVCYILAGSMVRGEATETSDVDTFVVIDDTDVTRMTAQELKSKLSAIIVGMAGEACMAAGVKNTLNVQVYILTNMWNSIREAHPVIFTFLRDGVPLYDRGMFMPWKLMLKQGRIKPTPEAVKGYISSGKKMIERIKSKLKEMAIEDLFWAASIPAQGALMLEGIEPPDAIHTPGDMRDHFVKKRKLLTDKDIKALEDNLKIRKDVEHGKVKEVSAAAVAKNLEQSEKFLDRIEKLFKELECERVKKESKELWNKSLEDIEAALKIIGVSGSKTPITDFKKRLVDRKLAPMRYYNLLRDIEAAAKTCDISRERLASMRFEQDRLARDVFDHIRVGGGKLEKFKISAQYRNSKKTANIWLLTDKAYIIMDAADPKTAIKSFDIDKEGSLVNPKKTSLNEIDKVLSKFAGTPTTMTASTIKSLKKVLSDDVKLVVGV